MNSLPDIIVLDFCEWLSQQLKNNSDRPTTLDIIIGSGNNQQRLKEYAQEYLESKKTSECLIKELMLLFFNSKEYHDALNDCRHFNCRKKMRYIDSHDLYECMHCPEMYHAFHDFIMNSHGILQSINDISASHLADYTQFVLLNENRKSELYQHPAFRNVYGYLIMNSSLELSEELSFFNWLEHNMDCATDVRKMPSSVFEMMVDSYIKDCKKTESEKKKLLKSYHQTGWEVLLEKFQVLARLKSRNSKSLSQVIERYYSRYGRYKCIILPLSDPDSQREYRYLIDGFWEELNEWSGDYLDIYYSEADEGKSGVDIAKRISSLPMKFKYDVPCIIIWEQSIQKAKSLSITGLKSIQIVELIKSIVKDIEDKKEFTEIIMEAKKKVAELKNDNRPIKIYNAPVIKGDRNIVGDNNTMGTGNVIGDSNSMIGNTFQVDNPEYLEKLLTDFNDVLSAIATSQEINDDMKAQLVKIIETAKEGVSQQSEKKQEEARTAFGFVKSFVAEVAPKLLETLANIATIASFFHLEFL